METIEILALGIGVRPPSFDRINELNEVQFRVNEGVQSPRTCTFTDVARKSEGDESSTYMRPFSIQTGEKAEGFHFYLLRV